MPNAFAPNGVGMFVWSWDDEGVIRTDLDGIRWMCVAPPRRTGLVGPYREKEASYYSYKKIYSPVQIGAPNPATFAGTLGITNRFDFTDLSQCTFDWQLGWYFDATDPADNFSTNALDGGLLDGFGQSEIFSGPALPPGSGMGTAGTLALPAFPAGWTNYDALRLVATDPCGNNIYTWTWPLHTQAQIDSRDHGSRLRPVRQPSRAGTSATEIMVTNGPRIFHFSKTTGILNSLTVSNLAGVLQQRASPGVRPGLGGHQHHQLHRRHELLCRREQSRQHHQCVSLWTLRPDGWLKLDYQYWLTGAQSYFGITFNYPNDQVTAMNWLGQGPYRVWQNRLAGQEIFTHTKAYNFTWTGQSTNWGANYGVPTTQWSLS